MFKIKSQIPFDNAVHSQVAPVTKYIYIYIYIYILLLVCFSKSKT